MFQDYAVGTLSSGGCICLKYTLSCDCGNCICGEGGEEDDRDDEDWDPGNPNPSFIQWTTSETIGPLVLTKWGQRYPYNRIIMERKGVSFLAGCVAIAVSQIVTYNQYPTGYDWGKIRQLRSFYSGVYSHGIEENEIAAGGLIYVVAELCDMDYGTGSSSTLDKDAKSCLSVLGYTNVTKYNSYREGKIYDMLNQSRPVYIGATEKGSGGIFETPNGHAWVIDGYMIQQGYVGTGCVGVRKFMHCNYGWEGAHDGYYSSGVFGDLHRHYVDKGIGDAGRNNEFHYSKNYRIITYNRP